MYNYSVNLTYRNENDTIYRRELLSCLNMSEYDNDGVNKKIDLLYDIFKEHFNDMLSFIKNNHPYSGIIPFDDKSCFMFLFAWEYFYETHQLLVEIHNKGKDIADKKTILFNKIKSENKK